MNGIIVDGVAHTTASIRQLVRERHSLADENRRLKARLHSNDAHLRLRTSALTRLIAYRSATLKPCPSSCLCSRPPSESASSLSRTPEGTGQ